MARESDDMHVLSWLEDGELLTLIERMPLAQRQVMLLRYMMDLSCPEIAAILGRSPDAIRQLQHRALTFLRGRLTALGREPKTAGAPMPMLSLVPRSRVLGARRMALRAS
jgi:DNA-directed RNA polymerase specialized sigma24 family protein